MEPATSILDVDAALEAALLARVREIAGELAARGLRVEVATEVSPEPGARLRWHITSQTG